MRGGTSARRRLVLTMLLVALLTASSASTAPSPRCCPVVVVAGAARSPTVEAPDAARLRCPRRLDARTHGDAGQRPRLGGGRRVWGRAISGSSSSRSSAPAPRRHDSGWWSLLADRTLPDRRPKTISKDLSDHALVLAREYGLTSDATASTEGSTGDASLTRESGLLELVIPPRSPFIGERVFVGNGDRRRSSLIVAAAQRRGEPISKEKEVALAAGDVVVLQGPWGALDERAEDPGFLLDDQPASVQRPAVPMGLRATEALVVFAGMVVLLVSGLVPTAVAGLLAAGALIVLGVRVHGPGVSGRQLDDGHPWSALCCRWTAMFETGAADAGGREHHQPSVGSMGTVRSSPGCSSSPRSSASSSATPRRP